MSRLKSLVTSAVSAALISLTPASVDAVQARHTLSYGGYVGAGTIISASKNHCFTSHDAGIRVFSDSRYCPRKKDVEGAIDYANDLFGNKTVYGVKMFYTSEVFWCGGVLAQGCTLFIEETGSIYVIVSDAGNGWNPVTAHEWGHVAQILTGHVGDPHEPADLYRLAEEYRGED